MTLIDDLFEQLKDSRRIEDLIVRSSDLQKSTECDKKPTVISQHYTCFHTDEHEKIVPSCHRALLLLIIKFIANKPELLTDDVKKKLGDLFEGNNLKIDGLVHLDILKLLHGGSGSQIMTWIKFESLLVHLIKQLIYEPRTIANEVLALAKMELDPKLAAKFASVLRPCAKVCREVNTKHAEDEEVEEKWCEIIDWMGWFIADDGDDFG